MHLSLVYAAGLVVAVTKGHDSLLGKDANEENTAVLFQCLVSLGYCQSPLPGHQLLLGVFSRFAK